MSTYHWNPHAKVYFSEKIGFLVSFSNNLYLFKSDEFPDLKCIGKSAPFTGDIDREIQLMRNIELLRKASLVVDKDKYVEEVSLENIEPLLNTIGVRVLNITEHSGLTKIDVSHQTKQATILHSNDTLIVSKSRANLVDSIAQLYLSNNPIHQFVTTSNSEVSCYKPIHIRDAHFETIVSSNLIESAIENINTSPELIAVEISLLECTATVHSVAHLTEKPLLLRNNNSNKVKLKSVLCRWDQDGGSRAIPPKETLEKLKPFICDKFGIVTHIEVLEVCGNSPVKIYRTGFFRGPHTTLGKHNSSFVQICLGKGVTPAQSQVSGICEAIERKNAQFIGNEQYKLSTPCELRARYITFNDLLPYSDSQYHCFADVESPESLRKQAVIRYGSEPVHWYKLWSLTNNESVYAPLVCCFANTPFTDTKYGFWHSNGCAAGNNFEEAILQALFELIERDATAIWWYNKVSRPSFDLSLIDTEYFDPLNNSLSQTHEFWVLDITNDLSVPVMAAIGRNKEDGGFIFGFGCHIKPEMAAQRALTELCQLIPIRDQNEAPFDFNTISDENYLYPNNHQTGQSHTSQYSNDIKECVFQIINTLKNSGLEVLAFDYTRNISPMHTAKVFVPGLCHIWPQLGNPRLYDTPVELGWLNEPLTEQTINQQGLYI
ncbi:YcaO-like family protein [Pseudoalteromonas sp. MMG022]|uniref:YcaO-like family protein n=1 Tax=Pseudoalteromonas sp. MMG022 TaxID=2909978 RepID=UPI0031BA6F4A|nr:YcaO-like family protein [Pseudoalteromonas sp. MMG022]